MPLYWYLVFFIFLFGCSPNPTKEEAFRIQWEGGQPLALSIPLRPIGDGQLDALKQNLIIKLPGSEQAILGDYRVEGDHVFFKPLLPFTRGLKYEIFNEKKRIGEIYVPFEKDAMPPTVTAIYPSTDSIPENLLKLHIEFSRPMEAGAALKNITVIRNGIDTIPSPFLDLEQELWNTEGNLLTIWLDPGRIKRELQPNLSLGNPLKKGNTYSIVIQKQWRDRTGQPLEKNVEKTYAVGERDSQSPVVAGWTIYPPKANTKQPLRVLVNETLDHVLLQHAIHVIKANGEEMNGTMTIEKNGKILFFTPASEWAAGSYMLEAENRLEDLAGNNLERLFEEDLTRNKQNTRPAFQNAFVITK